MALAEPYVVTRPGENLSQVTADTSGGDAPLRAHPGNADLFDTRRAQHEPLDPGAVIFRVVRPPDAVPLKLEDSNDILARLPKTKLSITVTDAAGAPEKEGIAYRLTVTIAGGQAYFFDGTIGRNGVIEREVPVGLYALHWHHLPIRYELHTATGKGAADWLAAARDRIFAPSSYPAVEREAMATIDPNTVEFADGDSIAEEDGTPLRSSGHAHSYLAEKIAAMRKEAPPPQITNSLDLWDNRWTALRPLLAPSFPLPRRDDASIELARRRYREEASPLKVTSPRANEEHAVVASKAYWYDGTHQNMALLGHHPPPLEATNNFTTLATAANKRLIRLWMAEVLNAVPAGERDVVRPWFASADGREHFKRWCGHVTNIGHKLKSGEHKVGHAIDIDMHFNPWCPVYSVDQARMIGEPRGESRDSGRSAAYGRIFDRALRLFVAPAVVAVDPKQRDPTALFLAERYYRNFWDWTPHTLRDALVALQVWNWAMIAYFHYAYRRAHAVKPTYVNENYSDVCPGPVVDGLSLWKTLASDFEGRKMLHPNASLVFEQPPPPIGPFLRVPQQGEQARGAEPAVVAARDFHYPFGKERVWTASLSELIAAAKTETEQAQLGDAVRQQMVRDHLVLKGDLGTRDPCRGVYNLSYDVALAFGRAFSHSDEYRLIRMLSFGRNPSASGGDFMHIDYDSYHPDSSGRPAQRTMRENDFMKVTLDRKPVASRHPWTGKVGRRVRVEATRARLYPTATMTDLTQSLSPEVDDESVCSFEWTNDHWDMVLLKEGRCTLYVAHSDAPIISASHEIVVTP